MFYLINFQWLPTGTDHFNHKPKKGVQFLQEHGVLKSEFDPQEIVTFLRENPNLDKKMIGEYISNRNNLPVLEAFVKRFDFTNLRIDQALRLYLETFRLPGEAPLISLLLEHFAEHWHVSVHQVIIFYFTLKNKKASLKYDIKLMMLLSNIIFFSKPSKHYQ